MLAVMRIPNKPQVSTAPSSSITLHLSVHDGHPGKRTDLLLLKTFCVKNLFIWQVFYSVATFVPFFEFSV